MPFFQSSYSSTMSVDSNAYPASASRKRKVSFSEGNDSCKKLANSRTYAAPRSFRQKFSHAIKATFTSCESDLNDTVISIIHDANFFRGFSSMEGIESTTTRYLDQTPSTQSTKIEETEPEPESSMGSKLKGYFGMGWRQRMLWQTR